MMQTAQPGPAFSGTFTYTPAEQHSLGRDQLLLLDNKGADADFTLLSHSLWKLLVLKE